MEVRALLAEIAILAFPILAAVVFHEVSHGAVAYLCGDPTAARHGRLTLNPLPHIDPVGTVLLPALLLLAPLALGTRPFVFGWAKPVPIDPQRFRHPRRDTVLVALAGPGTNLLLAAISAVVLKLLPAGADAMSLAGAAAFMCRAAIQFNCVLAVFNLVPIPPLDGGRVLMALLPLQAARAMVALEGIGYVIVLLVVLNTGVLGTLVRPLMMFFLGLAR